MHKLLLVSATAFEIAPLMTHLGMEYTGEHTLIRKPYKQLEVSVCITGVGMVNTAYQLGALHSHSFDLLINAGVCGAFDRQIKLGEVLNIVSDRLSELGAEDGEAFIDFEHMGLGGPAEFVNQRPVSGLENLKKVSGITVNTVHGNEHSINTVLQRVKAQTESMEGAAFMMACAAQNSPYAQIRAVSNYVERRNKNAWNMPLAISNLNQYLIQLLDQLNTNL